MTYTDLVHWYGTCIMWAKAACWESGLLMLDSGISNCDCDFDCEPHFYSQTSQDEIEQSTQMISSVLAPLHIYLMRRLRSKIRP